LAPTYSSRAPKPSCKAPATAIFATSVRKTDSRSRVELRLTNVGSGRLRHHRGGSSRFS
jgi:hypothetical protein